MLNVGSSTLAFRTQYQPWIDRHVFAPIRQRGGKVVHLDMKPDPGVDLVGDLADASFLGRLQAMSFRSVLCSNLLEHVTNREQIASILTDLVPAGGSIFLSCPYRFPYHPDPIDTMFRPTTEELAGLFPHSRVRQEAIVNCGILSWFIVRSVAATPLRTARRFLQIAVGPKADPVNCTPGPSYTSWLPWTFTTLQATCVVLEKLR
jgi:hypothetical protein